MNEKAAQFDNFYDFCSASLLQLIREKMGTYRQIYYHIVFGTKNRNPTIECAYDNELYKYIWGVIKNKNCTLYRINGIEDHIHISSDLHPSISLANYVKDIKNSQQFMDERKRKVSFI